MTDKRPEALRHWLRSLRQFKLGMRVLAKLGVVDTLCRRVMEERKGAAEWSAPDWDHEVWINKLYECIRDGKHPEYIVRAFVETAEVTFLTRTTQPSVKSVLDAVDYVCTRNRKALHKLFGVIR